MAGSEDGNPSDEDSEWSDFSGNSAKTNIFDDVTFGLRSLDPVGVINTLIACFPWQSDLTSAGISDGAPCANDRFKFHLQVLWFYWPTLVILGEFVNVFLRRFVDRILDRVDPSLETYGEPLTWRGSLTEVKFSRALNLPSCSNGVSPFFAWKYTIFRHLLNIALWVACCPFNRITTVKFVADVFFF